MLETKSKLSNGATISEKELNKGPMKIWAACRVLRGWSFSKYPVGMSIEAIANNRLCSWLLLRNDRAKYEIRKILLRFLVWNSVSHPGSWESPMRNPNQTYAIHVYGLGFLLCSTQATSQENNVKIWTGIN